MEDNEEDDDNVGEAERDGGKKGVSGRDPGEAVGDNSFVSSIEDNCGPIEYKVPLLYDRKN